MVNDRGLLEKLVSCFEESELETLIARKAPGAPVGRESVKVIFKPTRAEFVGTGGSQV